MGNHISWPGYEYNFREKTKDWFWAVGIIAVTGALIAILYENYFFALFLILAGSVIILTANKPPRLIDYEINDRGILIGDEIYHYTNIYSFWIDENPFSPPTLLIKSERLIAPILVIPIETDVVNVKVVREALNKYIPEEKIVMPMSKKFLDAFEF